jgi:3-methyladenine DNA glycosylase AlkD
MEDQHDLIHKACGWMLREVGKKDQLALETFLKAHVKDMPRTALRYAIEKFDKQKRQTYLSC